jgi:hypothetical protein
MHFSTVTRKEYMWLIEDEERRDLLPMLFFFFSKCIPNENQGTE